MMILKFIYFLNVNNEVTYYILEVTSLEEDKIIGNDYFDFSVWKS